MALEYSKGILTTLLFSVFLFAVTPAQSSDYIRIKSLEVEGNRKTKTPLILREMDLKIGDTLHVSKVADRFERNEKLLMNTGLFNSVKLNIKDWDQDLQAIDLTVTVVESWYIFPLPIFNLADRNLNVWWTEHNGSLQRVNYGLRFVYVNFTGNKDNLKLTLQGGYTRRVLLQYERPYINRKKTLGLSGRYFFDHRREFAYATEENKLSFFENQEKINFRSLKAILSLHYRPRVEGFHELLFKFERNKVTEEILDLNARFFNGKTSQRYFEIDYIFNRERRDSRFYPLRGNFLSFEAQKVGLGIFNDINKFYTSLAYAHYVPLTDFLNLELRVKGRREWIGANHPYFGLEALGFGEDYVRGYEFYVIDGTDFLLSRSSVRLKLFDRTFDLKRKMPVKNYRIFPISIWFTINADLGKSYNNLFNTNNPLNNRWLFGKGIGLDLVLYQKYAFQIEYSINHLKESGIFLNVRSDF
ncbi:MAG: BamA/TamA family outer membrane protein [Saprospiraceae bacterium]|nr:BamA/TamA family outer membrane protein [Saprospiraceae bacterium]